MNANIQSVEARNKLKLKKKNGTSHEENIQEENQWNNLLVDLFNDTDL